MIAEERKQRNTLTMFRPGGIYEVLNATLFIESTWLI